MSSTVHSLKERLPLAVLFIELVLTVSCLGVLYYGFLVLTD